MANNPMPTPPAGQPMTDWLLSGFQHDPDAVYSSASDSKGHNEVTSFRVPPLWDALIGSFVEKYKDTGYASKADVYRDAVLHRILYILERENEIGGPLWNQTVEMVAQHQLNQKMLRLAAREKLIHDTWDHVEQLVADGCPGDAEEWVDTLMDVVNTWEKSDRRTNARREVSAMYSFIEDPTTNPRRSGRRLELVREDEGQGKGRGRR